jgi:hypothetical protein
MPRIVRVMGATTIQSSTAMTSVRDITGLFMALS